MRQMAGASSVLLGDLSCNSAVQISELKARTEADCWDVHAWEAYVRETVVTAAKQPPPQATEQEIAVLEKLLKQFPSAVHSFMLSRLACMHRVFLKQLGQHLTLSDSRYKSNKSMIVHFEQMESYK